MKIEGLEKMSSDTSAHRMNEIIAAAQRILEGRREMARWRALKQQNDWADDYAAWERAGRELEHWTQVTRWRESGLVEAVLREIEG